MKRLMILGLLILGVVGHVHASQNSGTVAQSQILVNPKVKGLTVSVFTGRDLSGKSTVKYQQGEEPRLAIRTNQDAYVYLFAINSDGKIELLLPNLSKDGDHFVKAQRTKYFPAIKSTSNEKSLAQSVGLSTILVVASKQKLALKAIAKFEGTKATVLIQGQENLLDALQFALQDVDESAWTADTVRYEVVSEQVVDTKTNGLANVEPWRDQPAWRTQVDFGPSLSTVFKHYSDQVLAGGYTRRSVKNISSSNQLAIRGEYLREDGKKAILKVYQDKNNYRVVFDRQR